MDFVEVGSRLKSRWRNCRETGLQIAPQAFSPAAYLDIPYEGKNDLT